MNWILRKLAQLFCFCPAPLTKVEMRTGRMYTECPKCLRESAGVRFEPLHDYTAR